MSRKAIILSLSFAAMCSFTASKASAQLLAGNVWPNPTLETAAPAGVDQVYSYYNGTYASGGAYVPNATGDTNARPDGWHRGGSDFGTTTAPAFCFWDTTKSVSPSHSLLVNDTSTAGYGEWFSDFNALPASSQLTGTPFNFRYDWQYANLASTIKAPQGDAFRVSVVWADAAGNDVLTAPNTLGGQDNNISAGNSTTPGAPDLTTWTQVDQLLTPPVGAVAMRVTIDSGGSNAATGQISVDNISVAAVPEPASLGLLSTGAIFFLRRRRQA